MKFSIGSVLRKEKPPRKTVMYLITGVFTGDDGNEKYRYAMYESSLLENYKGHATSNTEYIDALVEDEISYSKTDYDLGQLSYRGHVTDMTGEIMVDTRESTYRDFNFKHLKYFNEHGFRGIKTGWSFFETVGSNRTLVVEEVGHQSEKLADDMVRLYEGDDEKQRCFVEHSERIAKAIQRGIWVPIKRTERRINGTKETEI